VLFQIFTQQDSLITKGIFIDMENST